MAQIVVNTGKEKIDIIRDGENVGAVYFSPSDPSLMARLQEVKKKISEIDFKESDDIDETFSRAKEVDKKLRELVDYAFDYPCSDIVFGGSYSFTTAKGVSAIEQFLNGAMELIEKEMSSEVNAAKKRQEKYLKKYKK